jgi:hypothetical protein
LDLKQSVAIPGTKIKLPIIEVVAAGAAVIGAYVLIKGQSSQSADVSTLPADTTDPNAVPATDATSILTGQLETMGQDLAALQAALAAGAGQQNPGGGAASVGGSGTAAIPPESIPFSDPTAQGAAAVEVITDTINPKAIITPNGPNAFTIAMPAAKPVSAPAAPQPVAPKTNTTAPATASNNPSTANLASKVAPNPVPTPKSANAGTSTTTINPNSAGKVTVRTFTPPTPAAAAHITGR